MYYYVYIHTNKETKVVFYVGIGSTHKKGEYNRAYSKNRKKQKDWMKYIQSNPYDVSIVGIYNTREEACSKEIELIAKHGRLICNEGPLVNISPGGHKWKDSIKVYQYGLDGKFIAEWNSPKEAASILGISYTAIYKSCRSNHTAGKFQFRTYKGSFIDNWKHAFSKKVYVFSKSAEFLFSCDSIEETARVLKTTPNHVREGLRGKRISVKDTILSDVRNMCKVKRLIEQRTQDGKLIERYYSLGDIKRKLNLKSHNSIDNAIKGKLQRLAYGFIWSEIVNTYVYVD